MKSIITPLLWDNQHRRDLWPHLGRLNSFISSYDFNEDGGWVAGHDYKESYVVGGVRKPGIVDLFYLLSPNEKRAVGVLANRTFNFYTQWDNTKCDAFVWGEASDSLKFELLNNTETWDDQAYNNPRIAMQSNDEVKVDVKAGKTYLITYIDPFSLQVVSSQEKYNLSGQMQLNYPVLTGTADRPILFFTVEAKRNKSTENYLDSVQHNLDQIALEFQETGVSAFGDDRARIYPNPAEDYVMINLPLNVISCKVELLTYTGMLVKSDEFVGDSFKFNVIDVTCGLYILKIKYDQRIETFKLIVE